MKNKYCFPAIFTYDHNAIDIVFPDIDNLTTEADSTDQAIYMAHDALEGKLYLAERSGEIIPEPSDIFAIKKSLLQNQIVVPICIDMVKTRAKLNGKSANKMVTMPQWLLDEGNAANINFSKLIQRALMKELGIKDSVYRR